MHSRKSQRIYQDTQQRLYKKLAPQCYRMCFAWVSGSKLSGCLLGFNLRLILILLELVRLL